MSKVALSPLANSDLLSLEVKEMINKIVEQEIYSPLGNDIKLTHELKKLIRKGQKFVKGSEEYNLITDFLGQNSIEKLTAEVFGELETPRTILGKEKLSHYKEEILTDLFARLQSFKIYYVDEYIQQISKIASLAGLKAWLDEKVMIIREDIVFKLHQETPESDAYNKLKHVLIRFYDIQNELSDMRDNYPERLIVTHEFHFKFEPSVDEKKQLSEKLLVRSKVDELIKLPGFSKFLNTESAQKMLSSLHTPSDGAKWCRSVMDHLVAHKSKHNVKSKEYTELSQALTRLLLSFFDMSKDVPLSLGSSRFR